MNRKGFTLIELIISIGILATIVGMVIVSGTEAPKEVVNISRTANSVEELESELSTLREKITELGEEYDCRLSWNRSNSYEPIEINLKCYDNSNIDVEIRDRCESVVFTTLGRASKECLKFYLEN